MLTIKMSETELRAKLKKLEGHYSGLRKEVKLMNQNVQRLGEAWDGDAHNAFAKHYNRERHVYVELLRIVDSYLINADKIIREYKRAEQKNIAIARGKR